MKRIKTKHEISDELEKEIQLFLKKGGEIMPIASGVSGRELGANLNSQVPFSQGQPQPRTLVIDEIKAIDDRRQKKKAKLESKSAPKKRIIYDDFGEPIREVWE